MKNKFKNNKGAERKILWQPTKKYIKKTNITKFINNVNQINLDVSIENSDDLYNWSIANPQDFWSCFWKFADIKPNNFGKGILLPKQNMIDTQWFKNAKLNFTENLLKYKNNNEAIVFVSENDTKWRLTWRELYGSVSRTKQALENEGLEPGDRVVAFMPNCPDTIIFMLATASIGATWSSCSPDFGAPAILDRFGQLTPKILLASEGYYYNGKTHNVMHCVAEIASKLPTLKKVIISCYTNNQPSILEIKNAILVRDFVDPYHEKQIKFRRFPFDHPLYILFSSGTTGLPKCIVHGAGGTLLQHLKEHQLHTNLKRNDRLLYFTTCGWMMWNWMASALASGTTLMLFDGSPFYPYSLRLFRYIDSEKITVFGTSAKYLDALKNLKENPKKHYRLKTLRTILSTGSPLNPDTFEYVYSKVKRNVLLCSISGGTDIVSCFVLGDPTKPVYKGEIQRRGFGMAVEVLNENGNSVLDEKGELTCSKPFPSMPIYFWNDKNNKKYIQSYFSKFRNVWCHGDLMTLSKQGTAIIFGRSDTTLNPGGVRIGTSEIYREVENFPEIDEGVAIGQNINNDVRIILFIKLNNKFQLTPLLVKKIKARLKNHASPRHVPFKIISVPDIPRTKSGKIVEKTVTNLVNGNKITNTAALANPESLQYFINRKEILVT